MIWASARTRQPTTPREEDMAPVNTIQAPEVVSRQQWITELRALLARETELTRLSDDVARQRRASGHDAAHRSR